MLRKVVLLSLIFLFFVMPSALADWDYPDYNEYISYTVETDFKEVSFGDEITFTITLTNHTEAPFEHFMFGVDIGRVYLSDEEEDLNELYLEPNSTKQIELTCAVSEYANWYKTGDDFFIDLCPMLSYAMPWDIDYQYEEYGLPYYQFENMTGAEPIPLKLNDIKDGSHLMSFEIIDNNTSFIYSDRYIQNRDTHYTYNGEYEGGIINYVEMTNLTDNPLEIIYVDGYKNYFRGAEKPFKLHSLESLIIKEEVTKLAMFDDVSETENIDYNIVFRDEHGEYYAVTASKIYATKVLEPPQIEVTVNEVEVTNNGRSVVDIQIKNISNDDIADFFIYYGMDLPRNESDLINGHIKMNLAAGDAITLPKTLELENDIFDLIIGYWIGDSWCIWELDVTEMEGTAQKVYTSEDFTDNSFHDVHTYTDEIDVFSISWFFDTQKGMTNQQTHNSTPEITTTPIEMKETPAPTKQIETSENDKGEGNSSHLIPTWVLIVLIILGIVLMGAAFFIQRKYSNNNS